MNDYISISTLNDFIFCPYSIYLHNVYMETDETMYHATPQTQGRVAHESVDKKTASNRANDILSLPVYSEEYGVYKTRIISTIVDTSDCCVVSQSSIRLE